jgi:Domain of unknown function (DUF4440)
MHRLWSLACVAACGGAPASSRDVLRAHTQALLDAVTAGDPAVWDRLVDPEVVYVSEAGEVETKASLLAQLTPLPPGITGTLAIARFELRVHGDTAVVLHVDDETVRYFGQPIHARYLTTATWRYRGRWTLVAAQVHAVQADPPAIRLSAAELDEYAGTYWLTDAVRYTIRRAGDGLVGQRTGGKPHELRIEVRDVLFVPGQPRSRKIVLREAGRITRIADRREGRDVVWLRRD